MMSRTNSSYCGVGNCFDIAHAISILMRVNASQLSLPLYLNAISITRSLRKQLPRSYASRSTLLCQARHEQILRHDIVSARKQLLNVPVRPNKTSSKKICFFSSCPHDEIADKLPLSGRESPT